MQSKKWFIRIIKVAIFIILGFTIYSFMSNKNVFDNKDFYKTPELSVESFFNEYEAEIYILDKMRFDTGEWIFILYNRDEKSVSKTIIADDDRGYYVAERVPWYIIENEEKFMNYAVHGSHKIENEKIGFFVWMGEYTEELLQIVLDDYSLINSAEIIVHSDNVHTVFYKVLES